MQHAKKSQNRCARRGASHHRQGDRARQDVEVLALFGSKKSSAQRGYRQFVMEGIDLGRQPALTGGGLVRSAGGWSAVQSLRKTGLFKKAMSAFWGMAILCKQRCPTRKRP